MPNRKRSTGPKAPPKLFRCHGYGNCNMVFTRSEHLARHERKHTGEKPYQCIVPGCERMFSRFDNMMQHTQTHEKNRKPSRVNSTSNTIRSQQQQQQQQQQPRTVSRTGASTRTEDNIGYNEEHNHPYMSVVESPPESSSMINSRTLPLPNTRRSSMSSYGSTNSNLPHLLNGYPSHHPSYYDTPRNRASWPLRRETAALHSSSSYPYYNPYNNDTSDPYGGRRSSVSTVSSDASLVSPMSANFPLQQHKEPEIVRRRISIDDLRLPIEDLKNIHLEEEKITYDDKKTVDITSDELEALEGFSKFHSTSVIGAPCASETSPKLFNSSSPNFASQVCAMRQRVMTSNESYQRG